MAPSRHIPPSVRASASQPHCDHAKLVASVPQAGPRKRLTRLYDALLRPPQTHTSLLPNELQNHLSSDNQQPHQDSQNLKSSKVGEGEASDSVVFAHEGREKTEAFSAITALRQDLTGPHAGHAVLRAALEALLIPAMAYPDPGVRDEAVVLLNVLYDAHPLQLHDALPVTVTTVGDAPTVHIPSSFDLGFPRGSLSVKAYAWEGAPCSNSAKWSDMARPVTKAGSFAGNSTCSSPVNVTHSFQHDGATGTAETAGGSTLREITIPVSVLKSTPSEITIQFPHFLNVGYCDWVLQSSDNHDMSLLESRRVAGRFIIHRADIRSLVVSAVPVDEVGATWDEQTGRLRSRGSFDAVKAILPELKSSGATAVYLLGALERPHEEDMAMSPFVVARRDAPATVLGGHTSFASLLVEIIKLGMTPVVDTIDRVSKTRYHRQYANQHCSVLAPNGVLVPHPGTDAREIQWDETALLNYRDINVWSSLIADVKALAAQYGVRGVRLDNAQSSPLTMQVNQKEMYRCDVDGEFHHTETERLLGTVVVPNSEQGYWTSEAAIFRGYPNPFIVKFCREMWSEYSDFLIIAESHFHREAQLAASGCIPHSIRVPQILSSINGTSLRRDGSIVRRLPQERRSTAATLSRLYKSDRVAMPKNAVLVSSSCTHLSPYPALLYGRRSWLAIDFLFFLPHIPMLLYGEDAGKAYRHNMAPVLEKSDSLDYDVNYDAVLPKSPKLKPRSGSPNTSLNGIGLPYNLPGTALLLTSGQGSTVELQHMNQNQGVAVQQFWTNPLLSAFVGGKTAESDVPPRSIQPSENLLNIPMNVVNGFSIRPETINNSPALTSIYASPLHAKRGGGAQTHVGTLSATGVPTVLNGTTTADDPYQRGVTASTDLISRENNGGRGGLPRRGSMSNLGLKISSSSAQQPGLVRTMSKDDMVGLSIRNMSSEELRRLSILEESARAEIGPETGYDLAQIRAHYAHRSLLRQDHDVFRTGSFCVLSTDPQSRDSIFAFSRFSNTELIIVATNVRDTRDGGQYTNGVFVELDLRVLWDDDIGLPSTFIEKHGHLFKFVSLFTNHDYLPDECFTLEEIVFRKLPIHIPPLGITMLKLVQIAEPEDKSMNSERLYHEHYKQCLHRLQETDASNTIKDARENHVIASIARGAATSLCAFATALEKARSLLDADGCDLETVQSILQLCLQRASALLPTVEYEHAPTLKDFNAPTGERITAYMSLLSTVALSPELLKATRCLVKKSAKIGPLVFLTAELGRFSTAGGLGVMVDELTKGLVTLGLQVYVVSPYYALNRKNQPDYLGGNIGWTRNLSINIGTGLVDVGVFEGVEDGVHLIFLERKDFFTKVYANPGSASRHLQCIVLMSLSSLEIFCQKAIKPAVIVTNDWLPSMAAGYARNGHFGDFFNQTSFFHLIHNLGDTTYEGRCFPEVEGDDMGYIHRLPKHLVVDPMWSRTICNPSRTALLCSDSWGTVSPSYMKELLSGHDLSPLLQIARRPFAFPNGIPKTAREILLVTKGAPDHASAKALIQKKYYDMENPDPTVPLFAFVGRVTSQKGVHIILNAVEELIRYTDGKIQILVGGPANYQDPYAAGCAHHMRSLCGKHKKCFWAAPDDFFTDGPLVNLGADFGVMPSLFEPGGIVQQEFFVAGTPVVAFRTGGLKDTVHEWQVEYCEGNGFLFDEYCHEQFVTAMKRALRVFSAQAEYSALRRSAYLTTIDVTQVAWAWSSEFHRIRNAIYSREDVLHAEYSSRMRVEMGSATSGGVIDSSAKIVDLCWSCGAQEGESVYVKGSWDDWAAEHKLQPVVVGGAVHATQLLLRKGEYMYKYRVGNKWVHAEDRPMRVVGDLSTVNNVLVVE